ncbi:hypothetical protein [Pedobacter gandavensis]|uniref:hypothetical protein n=1 Tax=Pedobacter gandavensis TaxID=2679963 RepID=UPI0029303E15|nr:hypothetical protein [Pedobacter gandavensis]
MYKQAILFYKTSWPGLIFMLIFGFCLLFGFFKAAAPDLFYEKETGIIDTAKIGMGYYQNNHTISIRLREKESQLQQDYPMWWYAPHPTAKDLKSGTLISVYKKKGSDRFYGISTSEKTIQPAWFDILTRYFNTRLNLFLMIGSLILVAIYHYRELIKNTYLWFPYATGILVLLVFWGYLNAIIFLIVAAILLKYILKKRKVSIISNPVVTASSPVEPG